MIFIKKIIKKENNLYIEGFPKQLVTLSPCHRARKNQGLRGDETLYSCHKTPGSCHRNEYNYRCKYNVSYVWRF